VVVSLLALLPWQSQSLAQALSQIRSHAVLVHGAHGAGQLALGLALARAWLCENTAPMQPACGHCPACHLVAQGHHPDLKVVVPEDMQAGLGWQHGPEGDDTEGDEGGSSKKKKPSREIKVEAIRQVVTFCQSTVSRGRAKVVVVHPAQRMNMVAANTLLKTLEEPPGQARFVLTCDNLDELMPTIRSRCQPWWLASPDEDTAVAWLHEQVQSLKPNASTAKAGASWSQDDARSLLAAAGGSPLAATELLQLGWSPAIWQHAPQELAQGQVGAWGQWPLPQVVTLLQKLCHDLACVQVGAAPRYFAVSHLQPLLPVSLNRLNAWDAELRVAQRHAEHPWSAGLKLQALVLRGQQALRSSVHSHHD